MHNSNNLTIILKTCNKFRRSCKYFKKFKKKKKIPFEDISVHYKIETSLQIKLY